MVCNSLDHNPNYLVQLLAFEELLLFTVDAKHLDFKLQVEFKFPFRPVLSS